MADWQDVGRNNLIDAELLIENHKCRSAVSRLYYAAFSALTFELIRRGGSGDFSNNKATPGHNQLPVLVDKWFTHMGDERRTNLIQRIRNLYKSRLVSDYTVGQIDRVFARKAFRDADAIFNYLEVKR